MLRPACPLVFLPALALLAGACATPVGVSTASPRTIHRYLTQSALSRFRVAQPFEGRARFAQRAGLSDLVGETHGERGQPCAGQLRLGEDQLRLTLSAVDGIDRLLDLHEVLTLVCSKAVQTEPHLPLDPEPAKRPLDLLRRLGHLAGGVGVLDAEQALAAAPAREEPVEEERPDAADMKEPRRRGRHADANAHRRRS